MSRMDRYKNIHKKAKPLKNEKDSFFRRNRQTRTKENKRSEQEEATRIYQKYQEAPYSYFCQATNKKRREEIIQREKKFL